VNANLKPLFDNKPAPKSQVPRLKRLRDSHHAVARLMAAGYRDVEIAVMTGYCQSRLSILKNDEAFKGLLGFYREQSRELAASVQDRMNNLLLDTLSVAQDRMDDAPDSFTHGEIHDLMRLLADRTGNGPSSRTNIDVRIGLADKLEAARQKMLNATAIVDVTPLEERRPLVQDNSDAA
jgi:hypothetical protein